jgi:sulfur carrier protein ThiS
MVTITFSAFLSLQPKLAAKQIDCKSARTEVAEGTTVADLIARCGLAPHEVEAVFLNGRVVSRDRELHDGDRVALVPPGTPGPHRFLLGVAKLPPRQPREAVVRLSREHDEPYH